MSQENSVIIGLEIENDMGQVSYCHRDMDEPVTLTREGGEKSFRLPIAAFKYKGGNRFLFGEAGYQEYLAGVCLCVDNYLEALMEDRNILVDGMEYEPLQILKSYVSYLIKRVEKECELPIEAVALCTVEYNKKFLDIIKRIMKNLLPDAQLLFMSKEDCFAYYAMSMKEELHRNYVGVFEYEKDCLKFFRLEQKKDRTGKIIYVAGRDIHIEVMGEDTDRKMTEFAVDCLQKDIYSAVYLTGKEFEGADYKNFVSYVCDRRRVFLGQNLFSKGACYGAYDLINGKFFANQLILDGNRVLWNVDIEFMDHGIPKAYRVVHGGNSWYQEESETDFIVRGAAGLKLYFTPVLNGQVKSCTIELNGFPKRPDGATRIGVAVHFNNEDTMQVSVRDKGFGQMFAASDLCITREFLLREDVTWMD